MASQLGVATRVKTREGVTYQHSKAVRRKISDALRTRWQTHPLPVE